MRTILSLRRHHNLKIVGIFLIVIALIGGIVVSCAPTTYNLTMAVAPPGGGTASDWTATSPYASGTAVNISSVAAPCYRFASWTAPAGTFADANAAQTTFTMPARDVTVTANFDPITLGHFTCYEVDYEKAPYIGEEVQLVDQFGAINATVGKALRFGNPAWKWYEEVETPISDDDHHFAFYQLELEEAPQGWQVTVDNQFGTQELTVYGPVALAVPTTKEDYDPPVCLDHFLIYDAFGPPTEVAVELTDQFTQESVLVYKPIGFANPVQKTIINTGEVTEIELGEYLVFYEIDVVPFEKQVQIDNQFGPQTLDLIELDGLAVPSQKLAWEQPLDHFKCHDVVDAPLVGKPVELEDQFGTFNATVEEAVLFGNPAWKWYEEVETPISNWDHHYMFYKLYHEEVPVYRWVAVDNQFGYQILTVSMPVLLAVPTQKEGHDPPVDLDHLLLYMVEDGPPGPDVYLWDQWTPEPEWFDVGNAVLFANPVQKTVGAEVTEIIKDEHAVFYEILGLPFSTFVWVSNQFEERIHNVTDPALLAVPSEKLDWGLFE
jgi:hypothetical protein